MPLAVIDISDDSALYRSPNSPACRPPTAQWRWVSRADAARAAGCTPSWPAPPSLGRPAAAYEANASPLFRWLICQLGHGREARDALCIACRSTADPDTHSGQWLQHCTGHRTNLLSLLRDRCCSGCCSAPGALVWNVRGSARVALDCTTLRRLRPRSRLVLANGRPSQCAQAEVSAGC
jgi:hypothetical protein